MRYGLKESAIEQISAVLTRHPQVNRAILYGSRAKGNYKHGSDIDLTLRGDANLTWQVLCRIIDELDDLLLPYTIDLSIYADFTDPDISAHIRRVGVTFYEKDEALSASPSPA